MMIIFFDHKSVIYQHAMSPKTIVNGEYYVYFENLPTTHVKKAELARFKPSGFNCDLNHDLNQVVFS